MTHDDVTMKEKFAVLRNEERLRKATYFGVASGDADLDRGGRYATINKTTVTGSSPGAWAPRQPASSPWHSDPCGIEPPLNYNIDDQPPTGEIWEQEKSMQMEGSTARGRVVDDRPSPVIPPSAAGSVPFKRRI